MGNPLKLAVIGDVHERWSDEDTAYFNASEYQAVLFVGDLVTYRLGRVYRVARHLARLRKPAYLMPGNHDATTLLRLGEEVLGLTLPFPGSGFAMQTRVKLLRWSLGDITLCGYSWHEISTDTLRLGLICGRPHSMGGGTNFADYLARSCKVRNLTESAERLCALVDACPHQGLIFLAHNGPSGLGARATDPWGCDFKPQEGDWGDPDLRAAIDHALARGRRVYAVVAGHMHHKTRQGKQRTWHVVKDGVHYINAARVPRIFRQGDRELRHHISLTIDQSGCQVEERLIPS